MPVEADNAKSLLLSGIVSDPSGARVAGANVRLTSTDGMLTRDVASDNTGHFSATLPAGSYTVVITAPGFDPFFKDVRLNSGAVNLDARLLIAANTTVQVNANTNQLSTGEADNGSQLSFSSEQLQVFSDDDATFQQQLLAVAGGDGSHPPQIYVDGFSGGSFPPKSSIREIKINQNPFSAEYDQLGFGRIEISTKPGTGRLHGSVDIFGDPSGFNSRNPFLSNAIAEPSYYRLHTKANISGPLDKKTSFFLSADYYDQQNNAIVNPTLPTGPFSQAVPDPQSTNDYTARLDRQLSTNNTATARYEFNRVGLTNGGLSALTLPTLAYNSTLTVQTLQLGNTQVLNPHAEHETKFEWIRTRNQQLAVSHDPTVIFTGNYTGGGSPSGDIRDNQDHFEFLEKGSIEHGSHFIRAGLRWRLDRDANFSNAGFNGSSTYDTLTSTTPSKTVTVSGRTSFAVTVQDVAFYAEDEWKARKSLTVDLGARFESQTAIPHKFDPSPHVGLAWAVGAKGDKPAPVVLRFGAAMFYDRFSVTNLLTAVRQGDSTAQITTVTEAGTTASSGVTTYRLAPNLRAEYDIYTGGGAEFNLGKWGGFSANLIQDRGLHQYLSRNANAPRADGTRPFGDAAGNMYQFDSAGRQWSTFFFVNPHINVTKHITMWAFYNIQRNYTDYVGGNSPAFVSNSYNTRADYGRNPNMRHMQLFTGGDWDAPKDIHISYFLAARAGQPFNITTPYDNNGDSIYNDRPGIASAARIALNPKDPSTGLPLIQRTAYGTFDLQPVAGEQIIPFDIGHSPAFVSLQVQAKKTWRFGPRVSDDPDAKPDPPKPGEKPKLPDPRYSVTFSVEAQNISNTTNPAIPIGVLGSPNFGKSIATANSFISTSAANRTFALHTSFNF